MPFPRAQLLEPRPQPASRPAESGGFTLVEMLVSVAVLAILLGLLLAVTNSVSKTVTRSAATLDAFAAARAGFDLMNRKLTRATLNTYWDYDNPLAPTVYLRQSDLHFLVRQNTQNRSYGQELYFQAPETHAEDATIRSTEGLLNACSFFVQFSGNGGNDGFRPDYLETAGGPQKYRYRLMHGIQPTEQLKVFASPPDPWAPTWLDAIGNGGSALTPGVYPIADNVIALIIWPRLPAGEDPEGDDLRPIEKDYQYSSKERATDQPQPRTANQLPPIVQVTLVTISEASAVRLDTGDGTPPAAIEAALANKFTKVADYQKDLDDLSAALVGAHLEFQILNTAVPLRESKWSYSAQ